MSDDEPARVIDGIAERTVVDRAVGISGNIPIVDEAVRQVSAQDTGAQGRPGKAGGDHRALVAVRGEIEGFAVGRDRVVGNRGVAHRLSHRFALVGTHAAEQRWTCPGRCPSLTATARPIRARGAPCRRGVSASFPRRRKFVSNVSAGDRRRRSPGRPVAHR